MRLHADLESELEASKTWSSRCAEPQLLDIQPPCSSFFRKGPTNRSSSRLRNATHFMLSRGLQLCSTPHDSLQSANFHLSGPQERNFSFCRNTFLTRAFATWKKQQLLLWGTHNPLTGTLTTNIQRPSLWHSQLIMPVCFHSLSRPFQACILAALVPQFCANSCGVHLWPNGFCDVDEAFGVLIMSPTTCGMDWSLRHRCECQEEASYLQTVPQCLLIFHLPKAASCEYT